MKTVPRRGELGRPWRRLIAQVPSAPRYGSGKTSGRTNCGRKWSSRLELATSPMGALATRQGKTL